jgi:hypothetical protein
MCLSFAALVSSVHSQSLDFTFTEAVSGGGTITGEIDGLSASGASTPTAIIIDSQPTGYPDSAPINLLTSGYGFYSGADTFTVSSGSIVGADVGIYRAVTGGDYQGYAFNFTAGAPLNFSNENGIYLANGAGTIIQSNDNNLGLAGITYTMVPEPHQTTLLFLLACVVLIVGRKIHGHFSADLPGAHFLTAISLPWRKTRPSSPTGYS